LSRPAAYRPIARQPVAAKGLGVLDGARLMTLVAIAEADAYVAVMAPSRGFRASLGPG
jgi:hypothetical protein